MKTLMKQVSLISGILVAGLSGVGSAQAGNIVLSLGEGNFTPIIISPATGAGINFKIRNNAFGGIGGGAGDTTTLGANAVYDGNCAGAPDCGYFDFFGTSNVTGFNNGPIAGLTGPNVFVPASFPLTASSGLGVIQLISTNFGTAFDGIQGQQGLLKDFKLPFLGSQNNFNPNLPVNITGLLDFGRNAAGDPITANTFDATTLTNITFRPTNNGAGTEAAFQFEGFWNVLQGGTIVRNSGTVNLSQAITVPLATIVSQAQGVNGFRSGYSGQTRLTAIPEPNALVGLAVFAGAGTLLNRKRKSK